MSMTARWWVALAVAAPVTLVGAPAAAGPSEVLVDARDRAGDVRIHRATSGLSMRKRRSIDLRRVTVTRVGDRYRFEVRVRKLMRRPGFHQMAFIEFRAADPSRVVLGQLGMSPQHRA